MIDGVVWKLRDPRVSPRAHGRDRGAGGAAGPGSGSGVARCAALGVAAVALVLLAGVDQWRYRLALRRVGPGGAGRGGARESLRLGRAGPAAADAWSSAATRRRFAPTSRRPSPAIPATSTRWSTPACWPSSKRGPATRSGIGPTPWSRIPASSTCTSTWPSSSTSQDRPADAAPALPRLSRSGWCKQGRRRLAGSRDGDSGRGEVRRRPVAQRPARRGPVAVRARRGDGQADGIGGPRAGGARASGVRPPSRAVDRAAWQPRATTLSAMRLSGSRARPPDPSPLAAAAQSPTEPFWPGAKYDPAIPTLAAGRRPRARRGDHVARAGGELPAGAAKAAPTARG